MHFSLAFPHDYEVFLSELPGNPSNRSVYYFPGLDREMGSGGDGLILEFYPNEGLPWIGVFEFGYDAAVSFSGVLSHPDSGTVCVVSRGRGYRVPVARPKDWTEIRTFPIVEALALLESRVIVFADFTHVEAEGAQGWK